MKATPSYTIALFNNSTPQQWAPIGTFPYDVMPGGVALTGSVRIDHRTRAQLRATGAILHPDAHRRWAILLLTRRAQLRQCSDPSYAGLSIWR